MRKILLVGVLASLSTACISVSKSVLNDSYAFRPIDGAEVYVFFPYDEICEHDRLAILAAEGDEDWTSEGGMIDKLREEAGKLGANAIILNAVTEPGGGERIVAAATLDSAERRGQAVAIRCLDWDGDGLDRFRRR
jgi:hypothetical protein